MRIKNENEIEINCGCKNMKINIKKNKDYRIILTVFSKSPEKHPDYVGDITAISQEISCQNHALLSRSAGSPKKMDALYDGFPY